MGKKMVEGKVVMTNRQRLVLGMALAVVAIGGIVGAEVLWRLASREFGGPAKLTSFLAACLGVAAVSVAASKLKEPSRLMILMIAVLVFFAPALILMSRTWGHTSPRQVSANAIHQICYAMQTYRTEFGGYLPFDERGPLESLALLYPRYLDSPLVFRDPGLLRERHVELEQIVFPEGTSLAGAPCWYGFTWHVPLDAPADFAVVADEPSLFTCGGSGGGANVGYVDGIVKWQSTPYCSHDPADNIYAPERGWEADTDSYIRQ